MEPANTVIKKLGGVRAVARELKIYPSSVSRWCKPIENHGLGGRIPSKRQSKLLIMAARLSIDLKPGDLVQLSD